MLAAVLLACACSAQLPTATSAPPGTPGSPAASACRALDIKPGSGAALVAVAERAPIAVAFVLDAASGAIRGRVEIPSAVPEVALDAKGKQLVVLCEGPQSSQLVAFDLGTLAERWRVGTTDPHTTKATGGLPTLGVSRDGNFLFVQHSKALLADAEAPGEADTG